MPTFKDIEVNVEYTPGDAWKVLTNPDEWEVWSNIVGRESFLPLNPDKADEFQIKIRTNEGEFLLRGYVVDASLQNHELKLSSMIDGKRENIAVVQIRIVGTSRSTSRIIVSYKTDSSDTGTMTDQYNLWKELLRPFPGQIT